MSDLTEGKEQDSKLRIDLNAELDADGVDALIRELAEARSQMLPRVPTKLLDDGPAMEQGEPLFSIRTLVDGGLRIWLRSEGMGWLAFRMSAAQREAFREFLDKKPGHSFTAH